MKHKTFKKSVKGYSLIVLVCCIIVAAVYAVMSKELLNYQIQFRSWISKLVYIIVVFCMPVAFFTFLNSILFSIIKANIDNIKGGLLSFCMILLNGILFCILFLGIGFTLLIGDSIFEKEERVAGNVIKGTTRIWLDDNLSISYYRSELPFFKTRYEYNDTEVIQAILADKYEEEFVILSAKTNKGQTVYEVEVNDSPEYSFNLVAMLGAAPVYQDDYSTIRANKRAEEYRDQSRKWEMIGGKREGADFASGWKVVCNSKEEAKDCTEYVAGMIAYVLQDSFFDSHSSDFSILYREGEKEPLEIFFRFGGSEESGKDDNTYDYYANENNMYQELLETYSLKQEEAVNKRNEEKLEDSPAPEENIETQVEWKLAMIDEDGMLTPEGAYEKLYEEVFKPQGDQYICSYNAKGNFYGTLSEGKEKIDGKEIDTARTVVYDRISKNGKCQLFVYYKMYYDNEGNNDNTAILNFYAVNKSTGEIIEGNKKAWAEVASKEYQEATGDM